MIGGDIFSEIQSLLHAQIPILLIRGSGFGCILWRIIIIRLVHLFVVS